MREGDYGRYSRFKTITPIYTGDAWQECREIKPASIIGSLRFWFEVLCYFGVNNEYFDKEGKPSEKLNYKDFQEKLEDKINRKLELLTEYYFYNKKMKDSKYYIIPGSEIISK